MKLLHLSPVYNRKSIERNGILPIEVKNKDHLDAFKDYGIAKGNKAIYTWVDSLNNEKYIKDLIYAIVWIHPRNEIVDFVDENDPVVFSRHHREPIYSYNQMVFDVFTFEIEAESPDFVHIQEPSKNTLNSCSNMHEKFTHSNKMLKIVDVSIYDFEIVGQGLYYNSSNGFNIKIIR